MCGIAGILTSDPSGLRLKLERMVQSLEHRGPDDNGIYLESGPNVAVGLGATRLAIRDLSPRGHQPITGKTGTSLVLNGEIYNAAPLRNVLERKGHVFRGWSDTEVALCAYEEWQDGFVDRLEGMFAIALWDRRSARLLLARDRLGIKPLYIVRDRPDKVMFASEIRTLLPHLESSAISVPGIESFLATGAVVEPQTMFASVEMLPPGHVLEWCDSATRLRRYWSLEEAFAAPRFTGTREEAAEMLRGQLCSAVSAQLVSDAPLGVFLSGGIDSSALVGLASGEATAPITTTSVVFREEEYSEARYIAEVTRRYQTDHHQVELTAYDFLAQIPAALSAMDQPTFDGVNVFVVSELARDAGLTVALSGLGSDELFAGYDLFRTIPQLELLRRTLPRPVGGAVAWLARRRYGAGDRSRKLAHWLRREAPHAHVLMRELFDTGTLKELSDRGGLVTPALSHPPPGVDPVNRISFGELSGYMRNVLLRDADVMSMVHGLEVRVPFLDERLVQFVAAIPGPFKLSRGGAKPLLVQAVSDLLPSSIVTRRKRGFTLPFETWLRGSMRSEVEEKLLDRSFGGPLTDILRPKGVEEVWQAFLNGATSWNRPWSLYVLKDWAHRLEVEPLPRDHSALARVDHWFSSDEI